MTENTHFTYVRFRNFKAFRHYSLSLREFNVLVGPNNSGKSTIIGAFRILSEGIRRARARRAELLHIGGEEMWGYRVPLKEVPVATENVFHNYDDSSPAVVQFKLTNSNELRLQFTGIDQCYLTCSTGGRAVQTPSDFIREFSVTVGFVPILGPVEHDEPLYQDEAARLALLTHRASRNFRNIWRHYPEGFEDFRALIRSTWPGMDIEKPEVDHSQKPSLLHMFCPEERYPRELYWAGFGFQVWCQMLTFVVKSNRVSLFIIDEPDIYLHSDLQRQLVSILKGLGPDILIATHSTEIISEADPEDLLVVNKKFRSAKRISDPSQLQNVFGVLGSNLNPTLTQLAKSKRAVFVEGKDFQVLSLFARKLGKDQVANRSDFAVIPVEGFNVQKVQDFTRGMELPLGTRIVTAAIFDRDYRTDEGAEAAVKELRTTCRMAVIHKRKEIENYLLHPGAIGRAVQRRVAEYDKRTGETLSYSEDTAALLMGMADEMRTAVFGHYLAKRSAQERAVRPHEDPATVNARIMAEFEQAWASFDGRMRLVPGKQLLAALNQDLQARFRVSITPTVIISAFCREEIPVDIVELIKELDAFRRDPAGREDGDDGARE